MVSPDLYVWFFMHYALTLIAALFVLSVAGCRTLHTDRREDTLPVAMWAGFGTVDRDGRKVMGADERLLVEALEKVGITATADESGLHVAPADEDRAREALLTDRRLADSGVLVLVAVPAGTGRRTGDGVAFTLEVPMPVPSEPGGSRPTDQIRRLSGPRRR